MHALMPLLVLLAAQPAPPQKSGDVHRAGTQTFLLEAAGDSQAVQRFGGSAQRAVLAQLSANGGASSVSKAPPIVSTSVDLPLLPPAGIRTLLEQAFVGGAAGNWLVREFDLQGQEVFVHQLDGVRLRGLVLSNFDAQSKEPPSWNVSLDVAQVRLAAGAKTQTALKPKTKAVRAGGVRVNLEGKEVANVLGVDELRFDFPAIVGGSASKVTAPVLLPDVLRVRVLGNDVKPWIDRLGTATAGLEVELLDASESKPTVAARISFENAQLVAVGRPCDGGLPILELEYRCDGPRLKFP